MPGIMLLRFYVYNCVNLVKRGIHSLAGKMWRYRNHRYYDVFGDQKWWDTTDAEIIFPFPENLDVLLTVLPCCKAWSLSGCKKRRRRRRKQEIMYIKNKLKKAS